MSWRRPKHCEYVNEDEDNSPNILSDKTIKLHIRDLDKYFLRLMSD